MKNKSRFATLLAVFALVASPLGLAVETTTVYGHQLMTPQERAAHQNAMRSMASQQERDAYRRAMHEQMRQRAAEQGLTLANQPRNQAPGAAGGRGYGRGMGGPGYGQRYGQGYGYGPGGGWR